MRSDRSTLSILRDTKFVRLAGTRELFLELEELAKLLGLSESTVKDIALRVPNLAFSELQLQRIGGLPRLATVYPVESLLRLAFNTVVKQESLQEFICLKVNRLLLDGFVSLEEFKLSKADRERLITYVTMEQYEELAEKRGTNTPEEALTAAEIAALRALDLAIYLISKYTRHDTQAAMDFLLG